MRCSPLDNRWSDFGGLPKSSRGLSLTVRNGHRSDRVPLCEQSDLGDPAKCDLGESPPIERGLLGLELLFDVPHFGVAFLRDREVFVRKLEHVLLRGRTRDGYRVPKVTEHLHDLFPAFLALFQFCDEDFQPLLVLVVPLARTQNVESSVRSAVGNPQGLGLHRMGEIVDQDRVFAGLAVQDSLND